MRRREPVVELGDGPGERLTRFRYADWADESEPVPPHARHWAYPEWHHIRAFRRFADARRAFCAATGRDYGATFYPGHPCWSYGPGHAQHNSGPYAAGKSRP